MAVELKTQKELRCGNALAECSWGKRINTDIVRTSRFPQRSWIRWDEDTASTSQFAVENTQGTTVSVHSPEEFCEYALNKCGDLDLDGTSNGQLTFTLILNPRLPRPLILELLWVESQLDAHIAFTAKTHVLRLAECVHKITGGTSLRALASRRILPLTKSSVVCQINVIFPDIALDLNEARVAVGASAFGSYKLYLSERMLHRQKYGWRHTLIGTRTSTICSDCLGSLCDPVCARCDGHGYVYNESVFIPFASVSESSTGRGLKMCDMSSFTHQDVEHMIRSSMSVHPPRLSSAVLPTTQAPVSASSRSCLGQEWQPLLYTASSLSLEHAARPVILSKRKPLNDAKLAYRLSLAADSGHVVPPLEMAELLRPYIRAMGPSYVGCEPRDMILLMPTPLTLAVRFSSTFSFLCPRAGGLAVLHSTPCVFLVVTQGRAVLTCTESTCGHHLPVKLFSHKLPEEVWQQIATLWYPLIPLTTTD